MHPHDVTAWIAVRDTGMDLMTLSASKEECARIVEVIRRLNWEISVGKDEEHPVEHIIPVRLTAEMEAKIQPLELHRTADGGMHILRTDVRVLPCTCDATPAGYQPLPMTPSGSGPTASVLVTDIQPVRKKRRYTRSKKTTGIESSAQEVQQREENP